MKKITLLRHGIVDTKSDINISSNEFGDWINQYDNANINKVCSNKDEVYKILNESDLIICSSLKRSIQSAEFFDKKIVVINSIFNEAPLPFVRGNFLKLKATYWLIFFRLIWFLGYSNRSESLKCFKNRAKKAAEVLQILSNENQNIVLVGHGVMNKFLQKELRLKNYKQTKNTGNKNWNYSVYELSNTRK